MKTIEESFKAEKEILEEFFENRRIKEIKKIVIQFIFQTDPYIVIVNIKVVC